MKENNRKLIVIMAFGFLAYAIGAGSLYELYGFGEGSSSAFGLVLMVVTILVLFQMLKRSNK